MSACHEQGLTDRTWSFFSDIEHKLCITSRLCFGSSLQIFVGIGSVAALKLVAQAMSDVELATELVAGLGQIGVRREGKFRRRCAAVVGYRGPTKLLQPMGTLTVTTNKAE